MTVPALKFQVASIRTRVLSGMTPVVAVLAVETLTCCSAPDVFIRMRVEVEPPVSI